MAINIKDIKLSANAYFYKLRDGMSLSNADIHNMMIEVTAEKQKNLLFNIEREINPIGTKFSFRVFKNKPSTPPFMQTSEPSWKEQKIGYYLFIEYNNYVAILRKYAYVPKNISDKLEPIDYNSLLALHDRKNTEFKKMSLQNLDGSDYAIRNKSYESLNLSENVPTVGASRYFIRTVKGVNGQDKFALTLYSSRVNDFLSELSIDDVCNWVKQTVDTINNTVSISNSFLSIFAKPEKYSAIYNTLVPRSILIFYNLISWLKDDCQASFYKTDRNGKKTIINDALFNLYLSRITKAFTSIKEVVILSKKHYYCGNNNEIEIIINKSGIKLKNKTWDRITILNSPNGEYDNDTLGNLINKNNQFNVYFNDTELIYSNKKLFRDTRLLIGIPHFLKILYPLKELKNIKYEKHSGRSASGLNDWDNDSLFKVVEDTFLPKYTHIICDDCNDEWADHIAIGDDVVVFFASKHKKSKDSASDFQDVIGQALKNLGNMNPTKTQLDNKKISWAGKYLKSNIKRLRSNNGTIQNAVDLWANNIMSPNYRKEMCLVVDFLSVLDFTSQLNDIAAGNHPQHEAAIYQRLWLLSSFINGCLEYGVTPKIYCKP